MVWRRSIGKWQRDPLLLLILLGLLDKRLENLMEHKGLGYTSNGAAIVFQAHLEYAFSTRACYGLPDFDAGLNRGLLKSIRFELWNGNSNSKSQPTA